MGLPNMISCGVAHQSTESTERTIHHADVVEPKIHEGDPMSWEILFRKIPGIEVRGNYPRLSLRIRGAQSIHLTTEPLYVLEGIPLGHDFASLARATTPQEVKSIRILKGAEATMYGARGANGVVVVNLK
jgi:TonB-dependent SusC/RagA subfamily outer membrane receptor